MGESAGRADRLMATNVLTTSPVVSRRDPMKVAQYEVLGWRSEKAIRPGRDDRRVCLHSLGKPHGRDEAPTVLSSLPGRTSFLHHFPALRTGLLSLRPSRTA